MQFLIIILIIFILFLFLNNRKIEKYGDIKNPEIYAEVPSFQPMWMNHNWAFYSPERMKYGIPQFFGQFSTYYAPALSIYRASDDFGWP